MIHLSTKNLNFILSHCDLTDLSFILTSCWFCSSLTAKHDIILQLTPNGSSIKALRLHLPRIKMKIFFYTKASCHGFDNQKRLYETLIVWLKPKVENLFGHIGHLNAEKLRHTWPVIKALWPSSSYNFY